MPAIRFVAFVLAIAAVLVLCGCGGDRDDTDGPPTEASGSDVSGKKSAPSCIGLGYCECIASPGCKVVSEPCFCSCGAYECAEDCVCVCSGGDYLGCAPSHCPITACPEGSTLEVGKDGCPVCVPPPCNELDVCGCILDERCGLLGDGCICECGDFECPGVEPCDCACGGGTPVGCYDLSACTVPTCTEKERPAIGEDGCPVCVPRD